ncbi:MAG: hypothetical protein PHV71_02260 [Eubacteriales bacterium]|nr:hypothetical protein [Eubacteriales bacterium]MDD4121680.1 hypothetical protein [Eubacteriales bacterium]MDD4629411.1 hypothetical protein [Eubacteriales bacterium]
MGCNAVGGIDDSLLFFFLLLVIIFCMPGVLGISDRCDRRC